MKKLKLTYLSPTTETLVVRFEGAILEGSLIHSNTNNYPGAFSESNRNVIDYEDEDF